MIHTVQIEPTNLCNANCIFCPRDKIENFGTMTMETYTSLIDDLKRAFSKTLKEIVYSGFGEPFMDSGLLDKVEYARGQFSGIGISIYSNGSLITEEHIQRLADLGGNLSVNISLNGNSNKVRKALMGLDDLYYVALDVVGLLEHYKVDYKLSMVAHPILKGKDLQEFLNIYASAYLVRFNSWGGLAYPYHGPVVERCTRLFDWRTYDWQGKQIKCCFDIEGKADCEQCTEGVQI